jgi:hypothetical protein
MGTTSLRPARPGVVDEVALDEGAVDEGAVEAVADAGVAAVAPTVTAM